MMKGILFTFDAFGQWSEYDRSKMKWRMNIGIEWRPSMTGWPLIGGRPATFSLLSPPLSSFGTKFRGTGHMGWPPPLGSPIKGLPRGALSFIPQAHKHP
jgi:hypothetical protein